jgi:taurine dioxygenase
MSSTADLPFAVRPLTPNLGGEVSGIDLTQGVTPEIFRGIREAFPSLSGALFPPHELPPAAQVAFARQFGEVQVHVMSMYHADGHPELFSPFKPRRARRAEWAASGQGDARLAYGRFMAASYGQATIIYGEVVPENWRRDALL